MQGVNWKTGQGLHSVPLVEALARFEEHWESQIEGIDEAVKLQKFHCQHTQFLRGHKLIYSRWNQIITETSGYVRICGKENSSRVSGGVLHNETR